MRALLAVLPFVFGIATAIALWGEEADPIFFSTAAEVIAVGAVAMALEGRVFRVTGGNRAGYAAAPILIAIGVGLGFAFGALARDDGGAASHMAVTAGALAMGASAFALQSIFGIVCDPSEAGDQADVTPGGAG